MCFSATASFTTAAILLPVGMYCIQQSRKLDQSYWAFAMLPFIFGLQQLFEGGVWLELLNNNVNAAKIFAYGFLLFSHLLWLAWLAYSAYLIEVSPGYKRIFQGFMISGILLGASMYVPLVFNTHWLTVSIVNEAIDYRLLYISDNYISQTAIALLYSALVILPLILSSDKYHNILGGMIFISGVISWIFFDKVFISVWCYFSSLISLYIVAVITQKNNAVRTEVYIR